MIVNEEQDPTEWRVLLVNYLLFAPGTLLVNHRKDANKETMNNISHALYFVRHKNHKNTHVMLV